MCFDWTHLFIFPIQKEIPIKVQIIVAPSLPPAKMRFILIVYSAFITGHLISLNLIQLSNEEVTAVTKWLFESFSLEPFSLNANYQKIYAKIIE